MSEALFQHWPEYLMEAALLGGFMLSACMFATLLEHPRSRGRRAISSAFVRRALMGAAMGLTAVALIYSPWGQQSGAHMNPATTLTFFRLGKTAGWDAAFYIAAQFVGHESAGNDQPGKIGLVHIAKGRVTLARIAVLAGILGGRLRPGYDDLGARFDQSQFRVPKFEVFVDVVDKHQNALFGERGGSLHWAHAMGCRLP